MNSMTGYAFREGTEREMSLSVEIKGVNNRFLEVTVTAPPWLSGLEPRIRSAVSGVCGRGRIDVAVRVREDNTPLSVGINTAAAAAYMKAISALASTLGIDGTIGVSQLIRMEGVLETERERDTERYLRVLDPVLENALGAFARERAREGKHTEDDILASVGRIEASLETVKRNIPTLEATIKENIATRFRELSSGGIDENRVLAETAVLLMKHTVAEEVSRIDSHLGEFRAEATRNERPGKKLDFLCQEINREINTIGSKSTTVEASRAVVEMKEALENVREQLRNVE